MKTMLGFCSGCAQPDVIASGAATNEDKNPSLMLRLVITLPPQVAKTDLRLQITRESQGTLIQIKLLPAMPSASMSESGQNAKFSLRADVVCFASNNRHRLVGSAGPFGATDTAIIEN